MVSFPFGWVKGLVVIQRTRLGCVSLGTLCCVKEGHNEKKLMLLAPRTPFRLNHCLIANTKAGNCSTGGGEVGERTKAHVYF